MKSLKSQHGIKTPLNDLMYKKIKISVDSTITVETKDLFSSKVLSILTGFEEEYMKQNDKFMMGQSSSDALGLLNGYLDIKVKEKKGKKQK